MQCSAHHSSHLPWACRTGDYGAGDLYVTGPPVAGACLAELVGSMDYTMELQQGHKALYVGGTPVIRNHVWRHSPGGSRAFTGYGWMWRTRKVLWPRCERELQARRRRKRARAQRGQ